MRLLVLAGLWLGLLLASAPPLHGGNAGLGFQDQDLAAGVAALRDAADAYESADRSLLKRMFGETSGVAESGRAYKDAIQRAAEALDKAQGALGIIPELRMPLHAGMPKGSSPEVPRLLREAATKCEESGSAEAEGDRDGALDAMSKGMESAEKALHHDAWITDPVSVVAVLLAILALLFYLNDHEKTKGFFRIIPLLVFAYFVPTVFSNLGVIPIKSPVYGGFISRYLLPASLVLLVLSVDIKAILGLGKNALILFIVGTISIVIGGPLALLMLKGIIPEGMGEEAWKGLAAVAGSWIGGGANYIAIGESVGASPSTMGMMVVVDVAVAEVWMIVLLFFAGREKEIDAKIDADRTTLDDVRDRIEKYEAEVRRPTTLPAMLTMLFIAFGATTFATAMSQQLPDIGTIVKGFTWVVIIVTMIAVGLSFTPLRALEGAGASKLGSAFLYLLVARIGASAELAKIIQVPSLVVIGSVWMLFHAICMLVVRRWLKAPIFFAAVGSKANVGGAASAPILASAFHPSLAPVGVLLAIGGYVLGTFMGLVCAQLLEWAA